MSDRKNTFYLYKIIITQHQCPVTTVWLLMSEFTHGHFSEFIQNVMNVSFHIKHISRIKTGDYDKI